MDTEKMRMMVIEELGLKDLDQTSQDEIIDRFTEKTLKRVVAALFGRLPEGARQDFIKLAEAGDSKAISELFAANIPDLDSFVRAEVSEELGALKKPKAGS